MAADPGFKPCPFCGGRDIRSDVHVDYESPTGVVWSMCCYTCGARFPNRYRHELLVEAWDRRAGADEIERLETENARLRNTVVAADREIKASHADADRLRAELAEARRLYSELQDLLEDEAEKRRARVP